MAKCRKCGCTDHDCTDCAERTGRPCTWVEPDLCSACTPRFEVLGITFIDLGTEADLDPDLPFVWDIWATTPGGQLAEFNVYPAEPWPGGVVEVGLSTEMWDVARRLLPRLAKKGVLRL